MPPPLPPDIGSRAQLGAIEPRFLERAGSGFGAPLRVGYGCEVIKFYRDQKLGFSCHVGLQAKVLRLEEGQNYWAARVEVPGLSSTVDIPKECLRGGSVPWDAPWTVSTKLVVPSISQPKISSHDNSQLARAVTAFFKTLLNSKAPLISQPLTNLLGGNIGARIPSITDIVTSGVKKAGLFKVLNQPDFTFSTMASSSNLRIDNRCPRGTGGIYFRRYRDSDGQFHAYVGKAVDFRNRYDRYSTKATGSYHNKLRNRPGTTVSMHALCILPNDDQPMLYFACEQAFVSLLETYRPGIRDVNATIHVERPGYMYHVEAASYMLEVANVAARASKWPRGTSRSSFGCKYWVNVSSPLSEWKFEKSLWIRNDVTVQLPTGEFVPVANFRRTVPRKLAKVDKLTKGYRIGALSLNLAEKGRLGGAIAFKPIVQDVDGLHAPKKGDCFQVLFEVRKDGKPHPQSWARLPHIGCLANWDIANSWALKMQWIGPDGQWKYRYCQSITQQRIPEAERGTLDTYVHGAGVIHFLFNEPIERESITNIGFARVRQVNFNHMKNEVFFTDQTPYDCDLNAGRLSDDAILEKMNDARYELRNLNIEHATMPTEGSQRYKRQKCDTCVLAEGGKSKEECRPKDNDEDSSPDSDDNSDYNVCTNCYELYGRPCCSWTPGIYNRMDFSRNKANDPEKVRITHIVKKALVIQPLTAEPGDSRDPELQGLLSTEEVLSEEAQQEWDEESDDELNDETDPCDDEW